MRPRDSAAALQEVLQSRRVEHDLIFVIGPTAAGKSARALALALARGGEIISADSRHVYRWMDIGTNKPTPNEQAAVAHHLLDLRDPHEPFSLAEYLALARAAIAQIRARGRLAIVVGGTGQYIRGLIEGWQAPEVPPNGAFRAQMEALAQAGGPDVLTRLLSARDPEALQTIDPRNVRRVIRALEVIEATGRTWSEQQRSAPIALAPEQIIYLRMPREALYARADERIGQMVEAGWLDETRRALAFLHARGIDAAAARNLPAMSALGYRQMIDVALGRLTLEHAVADIRRDTRRFIRAQDVWFRRIAGVTP